MRIYSKKLLWSSVVLTNTFALPEWIGTYVYIRLSRFMQKKGDFSSFFDHAYKNPRTHHQIRGFNKNLWHAKWQNSVLPCDSLISKLKTGVLRVYLYSRHTKNLKKKKKKLILGLFWPKCSHINVWGGRGRVDGESWKEEEERRVRGRLEDEEDEDRQVEGSEGEGLPAPGFITYRTYHYVHVTTHVPRRVKAAGIRGTTNYIHPFTSIYICYYYTRWLWII